MSGPFFHSLHQRVLASDCEIPFLSAATAVSRPDFILRLAQSAGSRTGTLWYRAEASVLEKTGAGDLIVRFADETEFLIGGDGREIRLLASPAAYTRDDLLAYALGPVLTLALHLQGAVLLHASAVVVNGKAVLFAGPSGSGKSTVAAMLHRLGSLVLSDDVTEVRDLCAFGALPTIRLWPDVLDALYGSAAAFPDRAPSWDKKVLRVDDAPETPHEIAAILFLETRRDSIRLETLDARTGWTRLIADAPTARLPDPVMERKIFEVTSALADRVPMFTFTPPPLDATDTLRLFLERELA